MRAQIREFDFNFVWFYLEYYTGATLNVEMKITKNIAKYFYFYPHDVIVTS